MKIINVWQKSLYIIIILFDFVIYNLNKKKQLLNMNYTLKKWKKNWNNVKIVYFLNYALKMLKDFYFQNTFKTIT